MIISYSFIGFEVLTEPVIIVIRFHVNNVLGNVHICKFTEQADRGTWFSLHFTFYIRKKVQIKWRRPIVKLNSISISSNKFFHRVNEKKLGTKGQNNNFFRRSEYICSYWYHGNKPNSRPLVQLLKVTLIPLLAS